MAPGDRRPYSQVQAAELARSCRRGRHAAQIAEARARNEAGLDELLARADGLQTSGDPMAAAHHRANVLFNIMRGGVFVDGTDWSAMTCWPLPASATAPWAQALTAWHATGPASWNVPRPWPGCATRWARRVSACCWNTCR
jgi:hypothetical protein